MGRIFIILAAVGLVVVGWAQWIGSESGREGLSTAVFASERSVEAIAKEANVQASEYLGVARCSTLNCHGGPDMAPATDPALREANQTDWSESFRSSYSVWVSQDPHSNAYRTLLGPRSKRIVSALDPEGKRTYEEVLNDRCVSCHATTAPADMSSLALPSEGVGCESCHGPAGGWIRDHVQADWPSMSSKKKAEKGMNHTEDLAVRASLCVSCHVGDPGGDPAREVNHQLLGAGHPRLSFDFYSFQSHLPVHWNQKADRAYRQRPAKDGSGGEARTSNFDASTWAVGQAVAAKAALDQIRTRSTKIDGTSGPWPEFSDFDCYACHHPYQEQPELRGDRQSDPGSYISGQWYFAMTKSLAKWSGRSSLDEAFDQVSFALGSGLRSNPGQVAESCATAIGHIGDMIWCRDLAKDPKSLLRAIADFPVETGSWDQAAQWYWSVIALYQATGVESIPVNRGLTKLREALVFPDGLESPGTFDKKAVASAIDGLSPLLKQLR